MVTTAPAPSGYLNARLPLDDIPPSRHMSRVVLVTGGGGFIGSNLVRALLTRGDNVRVLDNFATGRRENLADIRDDVEIIEGDLRSYERVHTAVRGTEVVFHQGALGSVPRSVQDPLTSTAVNVEGTLNVLLAARDEDVGRVVAASSSSVYGDGGTFPRVETQAANPISPYAVAKLAAERFCVSFFRVYQLETVALRYFNVFGPRQDPNSQYAAVVPLFVRAIHEGSPVMILWRRRAIPRLHVRPECRRREPAGRGHGGRRRPGSQRRDGWVGDRQHPGRDDRASVEPTCPPDLRAPAAG